MAFTTILGRNLKVFGPHFGAMLAYISIIWPLVGKLAQKAKMSKKCCTIVDFNGFRGVQVGAMLGHVGPMLG